MVSICIPIYNYDARQLIENLISQLSKINVPSEIIAIDDNSKPYFQLLNASFSTKIKFIQLSRNIGRASIRNLLFQQAQYELLIFLDCDVSISSAHFVENYLQFFIKNPETDVICGGISMPPKPANKQKCLRWYYGIKRESTPAWIRQKSPYHSFFTGNFAIRRKIFDQIQFDERLNTYGHEDTLFGFQLMKHKIPIAHINNPVVHMQIEDFDVFIDKTNRAIQNLIYIINEVIPNDYHFIKQVRLLSIFFTLKRLGFIPIFLILFILFQRPLKMIIKRICYALPLFDLYKLGIIVVEYYKFPHKTA